MMAVLLSVGVKAEVLWSGTATTGNWGGNAGQFATVDKASFANAEAGNIIKVTVSAYNTTDASYWQYSLKQNENSWNVLPNFVDGNLTSGAENGCYSLTEADVTALKNYGLAVQGYYITFTKIELLTTTEAVEIYNNTTGTALNGETYNVSTYFNYTYDDKGSLANAYKNDFIRLTYECTATSSSDYDSYLKISNPASWGNYSNAARKGLNYGNSGTFTYQIADATVLEGFQQSGALIFGQKVTVKKIELLKASDRIDVVPLTIGDDGIATFGSSKSLNFSGIDNITPYYVSSTTSGTVTLTSVETTRGWAGYIIKGTPGTYDIPVTATEPAWEDAFNNLRYSGDYDGNWIWRSAYNAYSGGGSDETNIKTKYRYIFAKKGSDIGFYKLPTDYSRVTTEVEGSNAAGTTVYYHILNRHKAYLETSTDITPTSTARIALIFDDDETTGVNEVRDLNTNVRDGYYDLQGRKVAQPTRGLYIVNGRKVVIK